MPFKSRAQQAYMFAKHPKIAQEFARSMSADDLRHLPDRVGPKPPGLLRASDKNVKTNVEDASMDMDKMVRSGVLERLIKDLQELEFDKRVKPKFIKLEMHGGDSPETPGEVEGTPDEESSETPAEEESPEEEGSESPAIEADEDAELDPRLAKLLKAKKKGK